MSEVVIKRACFVFIFIFLFVQIHLSVKGPGMFLSPVSVLNLAQPEFNREATSQLIAFEALIIFLQDYRSLNAYNSGRIQKIDRMKYRQRAIKAREMLVKENPLIVARVVFLLIRYLEGVYVEKKNEFEETEQALRFNEGNIGVEGVEKVNPWAVEIPSKYKDDIEGLFEDIKVLDDRSIVSLWDEEDWAEEYDKFEEVLDRVEEYQSLLIKTVGRLGFLFIENFIRVCEGEQIDRLSKNSPQARMMVEDIAQRVEADSQEWIGLIYEGNLHKDPLIGFSTFGSKLIERESDELFNSLNLQGVVSVSDLWPQFEKEASLQQRYLQMLLLRYLLERGGVRSGLKRESIQLNSIKKVSLLQQKKIIRYLEGVLEISDDVFLIHETLLIYSKIDEIPPEIRNKKIIGYMRKSLKSVENIKLRAFVALRFIPYLSIRDAVLIKRGVQIVFQEEVVEASNVLSLLQSRRQTIYSPSQVEIIKLICDSPYKFKTKMRTAFRKEILNSL